MAVLSKTLLGQVVIAGSAADTYLAVASPLTANLQQATVRVQCATTTGVVDLTLPEISTFKGLYQGLKIMVIDSSGAAATSNITVRAAGSDTIEGSATEVISTNSQTLIFRVSDATLWERSA